MPYLGRAPGVGNTVTGNLKVSGTISAESINDKLALNGSDNSSPQANANDQILLEAGTLTDASHASVIPAMDASDNLLLEDVTPSFVGSQTILGDNVTSLPFANINTGTSTSGQLLTSGGAGVAPSFTTVTGGSYVFISDTNCTTQSEFTVESLRATYDNYLFVMAGVVNASATAYLRIYLGTDTTYASSGYYYGRAGVGFGTGSGGDTAGQNASYIEISSQGPTNSNRNYMFHFLRKSNNATRGLITGINVGNENATWDESYYSFGGYGDTGSLLNSIKFKMESSTSTITVGSCRVYGLVNS